MSDLGLTAATVHAPTLTHQQVNTLFWINSGAGLLITLVGVAAAPLVANLYHDPDLAPLCAALALGFVINSLCAQHGALLQRRLEFVTLAHLQLISAAVNGLLITRGRLPPFIATLGMMSVARGVALMLAEGRPISGNDPIHPLVEEGNPPRIGGVRLSSG